MARQGRYDDLSDNSYSRKAAPSSRILFAVIILSVLVCAMAVLFWVKILESSEAVQEASAKPAAAETRQAEAPAEAEKAAPETEKILRETIGGDSRWDNDACAPIAVFQ